MKPNFCPQKRLLAAILCFGALLLTGCGAVSICTPPPAEPCPIETLLIDQTSLPDKLFYETGSRSVDDAPARVGIDRIGTSFSSYYSGGLVHHVYRFMNEEEAFQEYQNVSEYSFRQEENRTAWVALEQLEGLKLRADSYKFACSKVTDTPPNVERCTFVAQYGPYETDLSATMNELSYADLSNLLTEIDTKMLVCLHKN